MKASNQICLKGRFVDNFGEGIFSLDYKSIFVVKSIRQKQIFFQFQISSLKEHCMFF